MKSKGILSQPFRVYAKHFLFLGQLKSTERFFFFHSFRTIFTWNEPKICLVCGSAKGQEFVGILSRLIFTLCYTILVQSSLVIVREICFGLNGLWLIWVWLMNFWAIIFWAPIQPGAVKLVLWRHWMLLSCMHQVTSQNHFHCTRLYSWKVHPIPLPLLSSFLLLLLLLLLSFAHGVFTVSPSGLLRGKSSPLLSPTLSLSFHLFSFRKSWSARCWSTSSWRS